MPVPSPPRRNHHHDEGSHRPPTGRRRRQVDDDDVLDRRERRRTRPSSPPLPMARHLPLGGVAPEALPVYDSVDEAFLPPIVDDGMEGTRLLPRMRRRPISPDRANRRGARRRHDNGDIDQEGNRRGYLGRRVLEPPRYGERRREWAEMNEMRVNDVPAPILGKRKSEKKPVYPKKQRHIRLNRRTMQEENEREAMAAEDMDAGLEHMDVALPEQPQPVDVVTDPRWAMPPTRRAASRRRQYTDEQIVDMPTHEIVRRTGRNITVTQLRNVVRNHYPQLGNVNQMSQGQLLDAIRRARGEGSRYNTRRGGHGMVRLKGKRIVRGGGLEPQKIERYQQLGRYIIHMPSLKKGVVNIKYPSKATIPALPQCLISQDLTDFILDLLEGGHMNTKLYEKLSKSDQTLFSKIANMAQINENLGIRNDVGEEEREMLKRFELVRGEIMAGNNNTQLLKGLKKLTLNLIGSGQISKHMGYGLLFELSCVT